MKQWAEKKNQMHKITCHKKFLNPKLYKVMKVIDTLKKDQNFERIKLARHS